MSAATASNTPAVTPVGKPQIDTAAANQKARAQSGEALAILVIRSAAADADAEAQRQGKRSLILKSLATLDKDGHVAFRLELKQELDMISAGANVAALAGHSVDYYRVLVSNYRTISTAISAGLNILDAGGNPYPWTQVLKDAQNMRKAQASKGAASDKGGTSGMRAPGAGRKPKGVTLAQVMQLADQLSHDDQLQLMAYLAKITKPKAAELTEAAKAVDTAAEGEAKDAEKAVGALLH